MPVLLDNKKHNLIMNNEENENELYLLIDMPSNKFISEIMKFLGYNRVSVLSEQNSIVN